MNPTTTTTSTEAQRALEECGIASHVAVKLSQSVTPDLIGAWKAYRERNPSMGPGALVNAIRHGAPPPEPARPEPSRDERLEPIRRWLRSHLPDLVDEQGEPDEAAVMAAFRIQFRYGALSAREHSQAICGAVEDARAEADAQ